MKNKPLYVVHLGMSGFPHGFAAIQRILLLFKGLQSVGVNVLVINRKGKHSPKPGLEIPVDGEFEGVPFTHTSGYAYRPEKFSQRTKLKISGQINEFRLLRKLKKEGKLDAASVYITGEVFDLLYYWLISRIIGFKILLSYVEYRSGIASRSGLKNKINDNLYDKISTYFTDGMLPISDYLVDVVKVQDPKKPMLKVPIIGDFDRFDPDTKEQGRPHFLYCGSALYIELVEFVLNCYARIKDRKDFDLHFILGGSQSEIKKIQALIDKHPLKEHIFPHFNIPGREIPIRMVNASALLIPMRDTIQDKARFPHKIGEYLASGNPMITCRVGEINSYFKDGETAIIAERFELEDFSDKMRFVIDNPEKAAAIGHAGRQLGIQEFDYRAHGVRLKNFIDKLLNRKPESAPAEAKPKVKA